MKPMQITRWSKIIVKDAMATIVKGHMNGRSLAEMAADEEESGFKGKCLKGYPTDIPDLDKQGLNLLVPKDGYCMAVAGTTTSLKLHCNSKFMFFS